MFATVTVPSGAAPGQTIRVDAPDGSRSVNAVVPAGMTVGQTFTVEFPPPAATEEQSLPDDSMPGFAHALDTKLPLPIPPPKVESRQEPDGFADTINNLLGSHPNYNYQQPAPAVTSAPTTVNPEKVLLVKVPSGVTAGQTLFVEVPGENRTLAATVPPGVSSFHVSYIPRPHNNTHSQAPETTASPEQKLLLVQVPPGTAAGSTLHVAVPDEPGRILAAKVPPHVQQFQVAYVPKAIIAKDTTTNPPPAMNPSYQPPQPMRGGTLPVASPYNRAPSSSTGDDHHDVSTASNHHASSSSSRVASLQYASPYHHTSSVTRGHSSHYNNNNNNSNNNHHHHHHPSSSSNHVMNDYVLPAVGAAALGTAAVATYGHFRHHKTSDADRGNFFKTEV